MKLIDREEIIRELDYWRIPGAAIAVFGEGLGAPAEQEFFGFRDVEKGLNFDENTLFCIASCSKSMTATLIMALAADGKLDIDRPVIEYVPELEFYGEAGDKVTLRDMLCHRTGFGAHDVLWPADFDRKELAKRMKYIEPVDAYGNRALYSNVVYALAGFVAEKVCEKPWNELMKEYIFEPIGMDRTCCEGEKLVKDGNHAEPYFVVDGKPQRVSFWNVDQAGPAASINSTVRDMVKWIEFNINEGICEDGHMLMPREYFDELHRPQIEYEDSIPKDCYACDSYGLGWRLGEYRNHRFQKHTGKIEGYSSLQMYLPDKKIGLLFMVNLHSPTQSFFFSMAYRILDRALGVKEENWVERFCKSSHKVGEKAPLSAYNDCNVDIAGKRLRKAEGFIPCNIEYKEFAGLYKHPGYGNLEVSLENGSLWLTYRNQKLELRHWGRNSFVMDGVKEDTLILCVSVVFVTNEHKEVVKVKVSYEPDVGDIVFIKSL